MKSKETSLLEYIHLLAQRGLKPLGYHWEYQYCDSTPAGSFAHTSQGSSIRLGYLKKQFGKKKQNPKRFVFIPGFGDTSLSWATVFFFLQPTLRKKFDEIIFFDFPGYGGFLSQEPAFQDVEMMRQTVNTTLHELKPDTLMGHSLGGWLAAQYASHCGLQQSTTAESSTGSPLKITPPHTLILINPTGIFKTEAMQRHLSEIFFSGIQDHQLSLRPHLFFKEPVWFQWIAPHFLHFLSRQDILAFMKTIKALDRTALVDTIRHISSPVWLLWGEEDTLMPASCASTWMQHLPSPILSPERFIPIQQAGHSPHIEQPFDTATILHDILLGKSPRSRKSDLRARWIQRALAIFPSRTRSKTEH